MAKNNRFPSEANKSKNPKPAAAKAEGSPTEVKAFAQDLVKIHYSKDNNHVLSGVHALAPGLNHVPVQVWKEVRNHPSIQAMIKSGHIDVQSETKEEQPPQDNDHVAPGAEQFPEDESKEEGTDEGAAE